MAKNNSANPPLGTYAHHQRHWFYVQRRRTRKKDHTTREILIGQLISVTGSIIAGYTLDLTKTQLITMAGTFVLLPGVFDLGGSVAGAMGARINHRLTDQAPHRQVIRDSLIHAFLLTAVSSVFLGLVAASLSAVFFHAIFEKILIVGIGSCLIAGVIGLPVIAFSTLIAHLRGVDPDNFIGPIETSVFDALTVLAVTLMVVLVR